MLLLSWLDGLTLAGICSMQLNVNLAIWSIILADQLANKSCPNPAFQLLLACNCGQNSQLQVEGDLICFPSG